MRSASNLVRSGKTTQWNVLMTRRLLLALAALGIALPAVLALRRTQAARRSARAFRATVGNVDADALRRLREAAEAAHASTVAAFATAGDSDDFDARDALAAANAERLASAVAAVRDDLAPGLREACDAMLERVSSAQLQLMAFAINRKNRGTPDAAQTEAETADRKAFQQEIDPLYRTLRDAFDRFPLGAAT